MWTFSAAFETFLRPMDESELARQDDRARDPAGVVLACAALVVGLVRFFRLGTWSLWIDEALTLADARHGLEGILNPVGYVAIDRVAELVGGPDEFGLRLLPALVGWACIPLTYWAFRPFVGARRAGLAALLVALSPWHLYWSQTARFYTMAQAVSLVGAGLYLRGLAGGVTRMVLAGGVVVALAAGLQVPAALLLGAMVAAPWCLRAFRLSVGARGERGAAILLAVALIGAIAAGSWLFDVWTTYLGNKDIDGSAAAQARSIAHLVLTTGFYVTPVLGSAFVVGGVLALRGREPMPALLVLVVLIAVLGAIVASLFVRVTAQYLFVLLPWIAVVATWPLSYGQGRGVRGLHVAYLLLLVLPTAAGTGLYFFVRGGERARWRDAYYYVMEQRAETDVVVAMAAPIGEYYLAPGRTDLRHPREVAWLDKHRPNTAEQWARSGRRVWIIVKPENLEDWQVADRENFRRFAREECRLMKRFPVDVEGRKLDIEVYLCEGLEGL